MGDWLKGRKAHWVTHLDFDEMMLWFQTKFDLPHPTQARFTRIFDTYQTTFKTLHEKVHGKPKTPESDALKAAADKSVKAFGSWLAVALEALKYEKRDPDKADEVYRKGLEDFSSSHQLLNNYALFLTAIRKDHDKAEDLYKRALEADPNNAISLGNYANFQKTICKDPNKAEDLYKRALEADPNRANTLGNYAGFLLARGRAEEGREMLERAFVKVDDQPDLLLELWFYRYAHGSAAMRDESLGRIKGMIKAGIFSPHFDMSQNAERAAVDGHPEAEMLAVLAKVIGTTQQVSALEAFPAWNKAKAIKPES